MLAVSVELLNGTFRGDPDGSANTGRLARGEWPPSPARLFAAFVAADGTVEAGRVTDDSELEWFEGLPPPVIYADPITSHQLLEQRYVARPGRANATHQEYVARSGVLSRGGVRVAPRRPHVVYSWEAASPDEAVLHALRRRAARVGYLGSSDSPVRVRVATGPLPPQAGDDAFVPDAQGGTLINVAQCGDLRRWDSLYRQWTERGASLGRSQFPALAHPVAYRSPGQTEEPVDRGQVAAWLRLETAVSGRRVSAVTALFKKAVLDWRQRMHGEPPAVLHGHGFSGRGYETARYLALPDVGYPRSRGRIHGLALWLPPGVDAMTRRTTQDAARAIRRLAGYGVNVAVFPHDGEERPRAAHPRRWLRTSRRWATAVPAIHERRRPLDLAEVSRWCRHAGLPEPIAFREERTPLVSGALDLAPVEVNRPGRPGLPYSHVELWFDEAVPGPVVIGSGRQRGFGLCVPLDDGLGS